MLSLPSDLAFFASAARAAPARMLAMTVMFRAREHFSSCWIYLDGGSRLKVGQRIYHCLAMLVTSCANLLKTHSNLRVTASTDASIDIVLTTCLGGGRS